MSDAGPLVRLGAYALLLAAVFASAYAAGSALVPDEVVHRWTEQVAGHSGGTSHAPAGPAAPANDPAGAH